MHMSNATSLHVSRREKHVPEQKILTVLDSIILDWSSLKNLWSTPHNHLAWHSWHSWHSFADQVGGQDHQQVAGGWRVAHRR